jgi:hypothetical protein
VTAEPIPVRAPLAERVYALIFNGITHASSTATDERDWIRLSERERIAEAVYAGLRAGNIEFRLGPLALLAEAAETEARLTAETYEGPKGEHSACTWGEACKVFPDLRHEFARLAAETEAS